MQWIRIHNPPGRKVAEWKRCACLGDDGTVYAPAIIGGNEKLMLFAASFDGTSMVSSEGHIYLPTDWLAAECPDMADVCAEIERTVREALAAR